MSRPLAPVEVWRALRSALAREPTLVAVGVLGFAIAGLCLIAVAVRGSFITPEGKMLDAATFTFGVGLFTLTVALLLPLAGFSDQARRRWRRAFLVFPVYGLILESVQAYRGLDPRFTEFGGGIDEVTGALFGVTALLLTLLFVILALRFFREDGLSDRPVLRLGIRYGAVAVGLSFTVGILMSVVVGREIDASGNLLLAHALGVHGIQMVPAVALMLAGGAALQRRAAWVHVAGIAWLTACAGAFVQALLGHPGARALRPHLLDRGRTGPLDRRRGLLVAVLAPGGHTIEVGPFAEALKRASGSSRRGAFAKSESSAAGS